MKVLLTGDWHSELHEEAVRVGLVSLGHQVVGFPWHEYFRARAAGSVFSRYFLKAQNKYLIGPAIDRLNEDLVRTARTESPDVIFVYRGTHILPGTLGALRRSLPDSVIVGYNNDDPFSPRFPRWMWRHYLAGLRDYDLVLAYRLRNLGELADAGARRVELLRSWFVPSRNYPVNLSDEQRERFDTDVVFVGHFEDDGRIQYLEEVVRRGWRLKIFGPGWEWDQRLRASALLSHLAPVRLVWGGEYNLALCGARIALCFLSKLNRDTYTRRCFEIPACRTVLLSEYSDDLARLYVPDREAVFFASVREMGDRLDQLMRDPEKRSAIAWKGYDRAWAGGHDVVSRMDMLMRWIQQVRGERNGIHTQYD